MSEKVFLAIATFPDRETAGQIGTALVERQCVACVNLLPGATSIYRWDGRVEEEQEVVAVMKTTAGCRRMLQETFVDLHPYECPELLFVEVDGGHAPYLAWVAANCAGAEVAGDGCGLSG